MGPKKEPSPKGLPFYSNEIMKERFFGEHAMVQKAILTTRFRKWEIIDDSTIVTYFQSISPYLDFETPAVHLFVR